LRGVHWPACRELVLPEIPPFSPLSFQKEWAFLCTCASPELTSDDIVAALLSDGLNWDGLLDLAADHRVQGVLAKRLEEVGFANVPDSAREKLQDRMRAQHLSTLGMTVALFRILQDFSAGRIEAVLVKGPLISLLAYDDPAIRNYVDLDVLVRHRDIETATQRMLELGFHSDVPQSVIRAGKIPGEYLFQKPGTKQFVELHTEHTFRYYPKPMLIESLFARKRQVLLDGRDVPVLSLEDEFVLNCIHGAKHFWERLMWVADIAAVVARHPEMNWDKVRSGAAEVGAGRMLRVALRLATLVLGVRIPAAFADEIQKDHATESLCLRIQTWLPYAGVKPPALPKRAKFRVDIAGGGLAGAIFLGRLSLSPTQEDWAEGAEERRSWVWDAVRRPLRLFRKYGSNE
jgi:hypothetical protein